MLFEAIVGPRSKLARQKVENIDFKGMFGAISLAIRRRGTDLKKQLSKVVLRFGDDILLEGRKDSVNTFNESDDFIVLQEVKHPHYNRRKMITSTVIILAVVLSAAVNLLDILVASLAGCAALFLTKCLTIREAYQRVEWKIIFLLACLIPLGTAIQKTGAGQMIADNLFVFLQGLSPMMIIAVLFIITSMLTSIMSNNATAILLAPIAISLAIKMGYDPKAFLLTVMFGASTSFITPVGYQTNTLIYGPGNYRFTDFLRVGGFLSIIVCAIVTLMVTWLYI